MRKRNKGFVNGGVLGGALDEARRYIFKAGTIDEIEKRLKQYLDMILIFRNRLSLARIKKRKFFV